MPRPRKCRRICGMPAVSEFSPQQCAAESIQMTLDEYETIRLLDLEGLQQEQAAAQMGVARTTVQAIYNNARRKLADCLVNGKRLVIAGGDVTLCEKHEQCPRRGHCCRRQCPKQGE
mgnify:FL=1